MKVLVTKCMCDVCGKEVHPGAPRFVIAFGTGNWDDAEEIPTTTNVKDMCRSCYDTIRALVNDPEAKKPVEKKEPKKSVRGNCDHDKIIELWKKDYSYQEIINKLGVTYAQINYAVNKAKKNGVMRDSQERKILKSSGIPNDGIEVTVDETGLVVSVGQ